VGQGEADGAARLRDLADEAPTPEALQRDPGCARSN
jgi:hypothetical protein